ncbi:MAG: 3-deoxy-7-phosphoheptulonate synthase [Ignavibacteria bacterium]|nr:3-deoxy-7-phosphoheptulonate synthase [Ignavibacteria bacterium]MBI3766124.1 3-deoxy-7-phosphoheptulonate synthase [Ignavibacteriales bacterium]
MIIVMKAGASQHQIEHVFEKVRELGFQAHPIYGELRTVIACVGDERGKSRLQALDSLDSVESVVPILKPFKLASKEWKREKTAINLRSATSNGEAFVSIGNNQFVVMAGPCSVESREQILASAQQVKNAGARILRGGAFKPRTSPYSFQGLEEEGLKLLAEAREKTGLFIVTEVITPTDVPVVADYADILQLGARNMQNFALLKEVGKTKKPVLLKRGMSCTLKELLMSAEYIMSQGNYQVILCERGIRTFEDYTRNTCDLSAVPALKEMSHLPVIVDPSHGTGIRTLVTPLAKAAVAVGADGLLIEVHPNPEEAFSDGAQSLLPNQFEELMEWVKKLVQLEGRKL